MGTEDRSDAPDSYPVSEAGIEVGMLVSAVVFSEDERSSGEVGLGIILSEELDELELLGPPYIVCYVSIARVLDLVKDDDGLTLYRIEAIPCAANYKVEEVVGSTYLVHLDDLSPVTPDNTFAYLLEQISDLGSSSLTGKKALAAIKRLYQEMKDFYLG